MIKIPVTVHRDNQLRTRLTPPLIFTLLAFCFSCQPEKDIYEKLAELDRDRVLHDAAENIEKPIETVTSAQSDRSEGGLHDFYSEGDYWWPDPENPDGPYIRKDGLTNPDNFTAHRIFMRDLSLIVPNLVAAYLITKEEKYAERAINHLLAWFVNRETRMNPNMLYSQAIFGRVSGRGIGIIDAIHLVEVVKAAKVLEKEGMLTGEELSGVKSWFKDFNEWITTHPYGIDERDNGNNHSICWAMQVAMYASFTGNDSLLVATEKFTKNTLIPDQLAPDGSFPKELARTKPYGYSLFTLDAMYTLAHILAENLEQEIWNYAYQDSLELKKAIEFMYPYIDDKGSWPYQEDVMYFEDWPMRHPALLFAYLAYDDPKYFDLWKALPAESDEHEVIRNFFIRQPVLWLWKP